MIIKYCTKTINSHSSTVCVWGGRGWGVRGSPASPGSICGMKVMSTLQGICVCLEIPFAMSISWPTPHSWVAAADPSWAESDLESGWVWGGTPTLPPQDGSGDILTCTLKTGTHPPPQRFANVLLGELARNPPPPAEWTVTGRSSRRTSLSNTVGLGGKHSP